MNTFVWPKDITYPKDVEMLLTALEVTLFIKYPKIQKKVLYFQSVSISHKHNTNHAHFLHNVVKRKS